jgi:hypothetical protein
MKTNMTVSEAGRLGGSVSSSAKTAAVRINASVPRKALGSRRNPRHYTSMAEAQLFARGIARPLWCRIGNDEPVLVKP